MRKDDDGSVFMIGESVSGRRDDGAGRGRETTARGENGTEKSHTVSTFYRTVFIL
jgi:hypothetical protein